MFHLGESQELYVVKEVGFGIYLGEEENATEKVLLPKKEVPEGIKAGERFTGSADCNDTYAESPPGRNSRASRR